jgi:iron(III) transport system substrate-binding protein
MRVRVLAFHKEKVKAADVSTYESLAEPSLKGRVLVRSAQHVYNQSLAATLLGRWGAEKTLAWTRGVSANLARKPQGGDTDQLKAIANGEGDVALVNSYYVARILDSKDAAERALLKNIGIVFPNQKDAGSHVNLSGAGITRHGANFRLAEKFVEFLVSKEAQAIFAEASKEYPVRKDVKPHKVLRELGEPNLDVRGVHAIGVNAKEAIRILDEAGWR